MPDWRVYFYAEVRLKRSSPRYFRSAIFEAEAGYFLFVKSDAQGETGSERGRVRKIRKKYVPRNEQMHLGEDQPYSMQERHAFLTHASLTCLFLRRSAAGTECGHDFGHDLEPRFGIRDRTFLRHFQKKFWSPVLPFQVKSGWAVFQQRGPEVFDGFWWSKCLIYSSMFHSYFVRLQA